MKPLRRLQELMMKQRVCYVGLIQETKFWPSSHSKPALPPKIPNLLPRMLKARNNVAAGSTDTLNPGNNLQEQESAKIEEYQFDNFCNWSQDCGELGNSDPEASYNGTMITARDQMGSCFESSGVITADGGSNIEYDRWSNFSYDQYGRAGGMKVEEIDTRLMDFNFEDSVEQTLDCSAFDIAHEMIEPSMAVEDDESMLRQIINRLSYERKFSASLYAYNGVSECLMLTSNLRNHHCTSLTANPA